VSGWRPAWPYRPAIAAFSGKRQHHEDATAATDKIASRMLVAAGLLAWALGGVETARAMELWSDGDASVQLDTTVQFTGLLATMKPLLPSMMTTSTLSCSIGRI
jgi:hypothetical protein